MSEATLLESRLSKVEQDNRRLKLTLGALLLALAAVPLVGAVMPQEIEIQDAVYARAFYVLEENRTVPVPEVMIGGNAKGIIYTDENGVPRASMRAGGIGYVDENGVPRASMNTAAIRYYDWNGTERASMNDIGIAYLDENETLRALMGYDGFTYWDENGTIRARMTANGIAYWDENGNTVWSTSCAPNC